MKKMFKMICVFSFVIGIFSYQSISAKEKEMLNNGDSAVLSTVNNAKIEKYAEYHNMDFDTYVSYYNNDNIKKKLNEMNAMMGEVVDEDNGKSIHRTLTKTAYLDSNKKIAIQSIEETDIQKPNTITPRYSTKTNKYSFKFDITGITNALQHYEQVIRYEQSYENINSCKTKIVDSYGRTYGFTASVSIADAHSSGYLGHAWARSSFTMNADGVANRAFECWTETDTYGIFHVSWTTH